MSFNLRAAREISTDETSKYISHLAKRISDFATKDQTQELENKEDIYSAGEDVRTVLRFHSLTSTKTFTLDTPFYPPLEPDLLYNTIWLQGRAIGHSGNSSGLNQPIRDISGFKNFSWISGDPVLIDGDPFDYGIHTGGVKSYATRFNRVSGSGVNHEELYREHIGISNTSRLQLWGSNNFSWFFRVRPLSTGLDQGKRRTLYLKTDQTDMTSGNGGNTNGARFSIDPINRRWVIQIKRGGAFVSKETGPDRCVPGNIYDMFITYEQAGGAIHLYLAKTGDSTMTDETLQTSGYTEEWGADPNDLGARLFKRGPNSDDGAFHGDFWDFKVWRNKLINIDEANNHWENKLTIADIPFGQVMWADYYAAVDDEIAEPTEASASFSPTSFGSSFTTIATSYTDTSYTDTSYTTP